MMEKHYHDAIRNKDHVEGFLKVILGERLKEIFHVREDVYVINVTTIGGFQIDMVSERFEVVKIENSEETAQIKIKGN